MVGSARTHNSAWINEQAQFLRTHLRYGENLSKAMELLGISDYLRKRDEWRINTLNKHHWQALSAIFAASSVVAMLTVPHLIKKTDYETQGMALVRAASPILAQGFLLPKVDAASAPKPPEPVEEKNQVMEKRAELVGEQLPRWDQVITDAISKTATQLDVPANELDPGLIKAVNIKVRSILELTANLTAADQNPDLFRSVQQERLLENQVRLGVYRLMEYLLVDDLDDNDQQLSDEAVIKILSIPYRHDLLDAYNFLIKEKFTASELLFILNKAHQWQKSENLTSDGYIGIMAEFNQVADENETAEGRRAILVALLSKHLNLEEGDVVFINNLRGKTDSFISRKP